MDRLYFSLPSYRHEFPDSLLYLQIKLSLNPNMRAARRTYRLLRKSGLDPMLARWNVYDIMSMRTERAGAGYGL